MFNTILAVTVGTGAGMLLAVGGNKMTNELAHQQCATREDTHQVVFVTTFVGDTYGCVDRRYL